MPAPDGTYVLHIWQVVFDGKPSGEPSVSVHPTERITGVAEVIESNLNFFGHTIFDKTVTRTLDGRLVAISFKSRDYNDPNTTMTHHIQWDSEAWKPKPVPVKTD